MFPNMKKYRFEESIRVDGVSRKAGDIVDASEIPPGNLESMLRLRQVSEFKDDPAQQFAEAMEARTLEARPLPAVGPTAEEGLAMVDEITLRGQRIEALTSELVVAKAENETLKKQLAERDAAKQSGFVETKPLEQAANPAPAGDEKKTEAKAKPPEIGPTKPPELKAGKK